MTTTEVLRKPALSGSARILVVEDDPNHGAMCARLLERKGYQARAITSAREALSTLAQDGEVDLASLIAEVRGELAGSDVRLDIGAGVPPISGDRAQLSQMLHNLVGNAIKYGRAGAPVNVRLWCDQAGVVRISVADEGEGIPPEHIPRLTERFYRVDDGRSRAAGGTGLGLAIVKHIVERHRGRLEIASIVGKGTTVTVMLPAHGNAVHGGLVIKR